MRVRSWAAIFVVLAPLTVSIAEAQQPSPGQASPAGLPGQATEKQVQDFKADNASILKDFPLGGKDLAAVVKALILADPSIVDSLIALASKSNKSQSQSIGEGIGQAAKELATIDRLQATGIGRRVAAGANGELVAGYAEGLGEVTTLAAGVAGGGLGAFNFTSLIGAGPASLSAINSSSPNQLFVGAFGGSSTACTQSVSPVANC